MPLLLLCAPRRAVGFRWLVLTAISALVGGGIARPARADDPLAAKIEEFLSQPHLAQAQVGLLFVDMETGDAIVERNSQRLFAPASVTKLFSTAAALDALGAEHRFRTPVHYRGELKDGVLDGDLILVASGDLTLGGRTDERGEIAFTDSDHTYANWSGEATLTPQNPLAGLDDLARQVAAAGIKSIRGDVLIDDRLFDHAEGSGSGPSLVTPIVVNDNVIDFTLEPTEPGQPANVTWRPETAWLEIESRVETVREDVPLSTSVRLVEPGKLVVSGKIPANRRPLVRIYEVPEPAAFARALFIEALRRAGVKVAADLRDQSMVMLPAADAYANLPKAAELVSPPFAESARLVLKVSHNLHASTLPLLVSAKHGQRTLADGMRLEGAFLSRAGVPVETISFGGGAGGARADFVTPAATVQLLRHMATRSDFAAYERALPILGVDGTLAKTLPADSPARGKVQAKTGTLVWDNLLAGRGLCTSKALAGYLTTASGKRLAFAAFLNGVQLREGVDTKRLGSDLGKLCEMVHGGR
ncbi:MAG: D-alanyl-D-alanine carboxypeptidase/D-alanyl-D-alanine-endopeptidase [Pirellulaceae bacterium]|nr:D-alanyl-D-alanine carboxypeptidase/D-alanyl-D-alanine-endopeptidase [Pirellulaceae bacterium]